MILDTAPVGMVTDTLLIGRVADLSVYVCRADYTRKAEFTLINELADSNKLPNLCTVINGGFRLNITANFKCYFRFFIRNFTTAIQPQIGVKFFNYLY